jgi:putative ABC transport system ATP-binding protein
MLSVRDLRRPGLVEASFELADGDCIAVRGPSGSGKTLLLRAIADLDPNEGSVTLDDRSRAETPAPEWRRLVCYVPAEPGWWAETVGAHFSDWSKARSLVDALELPFSSRDWPISRLSTGERQRFALIRALLLRPRVLLLDEPTSALDPGGAAAVESEVSKHLATGAGALWITHDIAQSNRVARRCLTVEQGRITETAP